MIKRRIVLLAGGLGIAMAIAAACGFPDPTIVADRNEGGVDGASDVASDQATTDAKTDGGPLTDSSPPLDALDERVLIDATNCNPCDCDNDGFRTRDASVCTDAAGSGDDCDDFNPRAQPDADFLEATPTVTTKGDWNCDGTRQGEHRSLINCGQFGALSDCPLQKGFVQNPQCGEEGDYVTCANPGIGGLNCVNGPVERKVQRCK